MLEIIESRRDQVAEACRKHRVKTLEVFGSAVGPDWDSKSSDLDFLVEFQPLAPGEMFDCYFDLKVSLEGLFGRSVDLVSPRAIRNPYFLNAVNRTRQVLYAA